MPSKKISWYGKEHLPTCWVCWGVFKQVYKAGSNLHSAAFIGLFLLPSSYRDIEYHIQKETLHLQKGDSGAARTFFPLGFVCSFSDPLLSEYNNMML